MSDLVIVNGEECLNYISKPLGFANIRATNSNEHTILDFQYYDMWVQGSEGSLTLSPKQSGMGSQTVTIHKCPHDISKRVCGLVTDNYSDGGKRIVIFGNEDLLWSSNNGYEICVQDFIVYGQVKYEQPLGERTQKKDDYIFYPAFQQSNSGADINGCVSWIRDVVTDEYATFDDAIDYTPLFHRYDFGYNANSYITFHYQGEPVSNRDRFTLTIDKNNTLTYGEGGFTASGSLLHMYGANASKNPLYIIAGDIYSYYYKCSLDLYGLCPGSVISSAYLARYEVHGGVVTPTFNGICIPYNIILTNSEQFAKEYVENGVLPPDAYLYPLDFENLPRYDEPVPTGDEPEDYPDDNDPDDDLRDFDPTPNETPTYTVNQFTNYNWYWLTVPQWAEFINWFWNDIGNFSDFDDIIAKVKGLYNDVASAVIMCRYYPVDISWIGGLGTQSNIKLGMIEKAGSYDTISQVNALRSVDIGHVHIGQKYKSFMDMSPYSQLSLYLPWHGFIDLDMNLFNGHDVFVKALYDYLSGTIQYYVFYDNEVLVNTILCKMAMDIPITLQTKNDRDSAIFNNVSSTIGGLVGAGTGILSGNPIGMTLGITQGVGAFNSANASAPMRLMGNVGESGAYIGCQNCFVVVRRPTIQASDGKKKNTEVDASIDRLTTWKKNVGMLCGYGYTLSSLSGKGFTVCHSPRINFTNSAPLQSEVDEIYNYLEKGVIL